MRYTDLPTDINDIKIYLHSKDFREQMANSINRLIHPHYANPNPVEDLNDEIVAMNVKELIPLLKIAKEYYKNEEDYQNS